jgi:uncharacterized protein (DUF1778 family)
LVAVSVLNFPANCRTIFVNLRRIVMTARATVAVPRSLKPQSARLEARISHDLHVVVKRAAEIQGRTMTDFVVHALQSAASQAIEQADHVRMTMADQEAFAQALISPAKPNAALKRAFAKANKLLSA